MEYKRNKDLTEVFNDRWKANNNDDVKRIKEINSIRRKKILSNDENSFLSEKDFKNLQSDKRVMGNMDIDFERLKKNMDAFNKNRGNFND